MYSKPMDSNKDCLESLKPLNYGNLWYFFVINSLCVIRDGYIIRTRPTGRWVSIGLVQDIVSPMCIYNLPGFMIWLDMFVSVRKDEFLFATQTTTTCLRLDIFISIHSFCVCKKPQPRTMLTSFTPFGRPSDVCQAIRSRETWLGW